MVKIFKNCEKLFKTIKIGDKVFKHTGDYNIEGIVVAVFTTTKGKTRYVVEHENGILHIYSEANIRLI